MLPTAWWNDGMPSYGKKSQTVGKNVSSFRQQQYSILWLAATIIYRKFLWISSMLNQGKNHKKR